ncbi:hypothetical protein [Aquimarina celericrescens]|uniref:Lipoprotein n=1 Tax=Aquimarina celericrescens TaxID=1964542 RepID=A0ABW5AVK1_9FLAO|nr:hypothetical protein [Aquimarina celericrescens]
MKKITLLLSILWWAGACTSNSKSNNASDSNVEATTTQQVDPSEASQHIIVTVSDRAPERIEETEDFSPTELRTARLKDGKLITTFKGYLGSFDDEKDYGLNLMCIRKTDSGALAKGTYKLIATTDAAQLASETSPFFESINTFNAETYKNAKMSGLLDDFTDEFFAPLREENVLVIESTEDLGETANSTENFPERLQRVKGYLVFFINEMTSEEEYKLRVDFNIINEIRILKE